MESSTTELERGRKLLFNANPQETGSFLYEILLTISWVTEAYY
jgi:hypothetical protein